jgi:hypothetical protein
MTEYLNELTTVVQSQIPGADLKLCLSTEWAAEKPNYRVKIREHMADVNTQHFSRLQWAQLYDLNQRPRGLNCFVSISHCHSIGGYSISTFPHGFDIEDLNRISDPIIIRTSTDEERSRTPHIKLLWSAKEAAFKALSEAANLNITDLICQDWQSTANPNIWSYGIRTGKSVTLNRNLGFVMSTPLLLMAAYFQ